MRILVPGGTGVFGRLCRLMAGDPLIDLTIGARDRSFASRRRSRPETRGCFRLDVEIGLPWICRLVRYRASGFLTSR